MSQPDVYDLFIEEMNMMTIKADTNAVEVVGMLTRAVKRAQNKWDEKYGCGHEAHMRVDDVRYGMGNFSKWEVCDGD